ncbi:carboxypeptidase-like regulatory domain-containing protein [Rurimicrobium arvi]|uniref:Carboxypeptidase-like regulatory domain-containing protein n=1 Tax=Rurimicrobium arvi TaxID=2049916 RepID=A0ABP8MWC8_9BACT
MIRIFHLPLCVLALIALIPFKGKAQLAFDRVVQVNGVVMTSDSLYGVPDVIVSVKNQNRGVYTSESGVFVLVCFKGDTIQFRSLGYTPSEYVIPEDFKSNTLSMVKLLSQDTFFLSETVIHALPSKESFRYVFEHFQPEDDKYEIARKNSDLAMMRMMATTMNPDGHEGASYAMRSIAQRASYEGMRPPMQIMSPIAWAQFIQAWKRGDFRSKKKKTSSY